VDNPPIGLTPKIPLPSECPQLRRGTSPDAQNTVHRFWISDGGIGGGAPHWGVLTDRTGTGLRPAGLADRDLPRFQGRCVPTCTSTDPPVVEGGGCQKIILPQF